MRGLLLDSLGWRYGERTALADVSLAVPAGQFRALLGPNGAGKSTLFALATRLFHARQGRVMVDGIDMARDPGGALARLGIVFQQPTLDPDLSVAHNLTYFGALHGLSRRETLARAAAPLAFFGLAERLGEPVRRLNGGHRRRLEIARALLHGPSVLLLDEPTVGLDIATRRAITAHVHRLCAETGTAVLWATHLVDEVSPGDAVTVLHRGRVVADGTAGGIVAQTGAADLGGAFARLTDDAAPAGAAP